MEALTDSLKTLLLAGVGAVALTAEKSIELINELVKKGELTVEQGKVVNEELKRAVSKSTENSRSQSTSDEVFEQMKTMSADERKAIIDRLTELDD